MRIAIRPFHGWRIQSEYRASLFTETAETRQKKFPVSDNSIYHSEALPSLYIYRVLDQSGTEIYSAILGTDHTVQTEDDCTYHPDFFHSPDIGPEIYSLLESWMKHPEFEYTDASGRIHLISVIQFFPMIHKLIREISQVEYVLQYPLSKSRSPFICLKISGEIHFPEYYPVGILIAPSSNAQTTTTYSAGF